MANTNVPAIWGDAVTDVRAGTSAANQAQLYPLGTRRREGDKSYVYVKYNKGTASVTAVAGNLVYCQTTEGNVVGDESDSSLNVVAGVLCAVIADTGFGWLQTWGICTVNTNGDDDIALGDAIIGSTTDGKCNSTAKNTAPTNQVVGFALAADVDNADTVNTYLQIV